MALCDHADDTGNNCYPGIDLLTWKLGKSESQTRRILCRLEQQNIIQVLERGNGRGNQSEYKIDLSVISEKEKLGKKKVSIQNIKVAIDDVKVSNEEEKVSIQESKGTHPEHERYASGNGKVAIQDENSVAIRKNQNEPVIEPEEPVVGKPATKRASRKKPVLTDDLFLEELQNSGAYPGVNVHQEFMRASNWCIANDRQNTRKFFVNWLGRSRPMIVATNGNGVNGNGQNGAAKSKFAADSEQRAESFVKSVSYFDRRVEAAYRAADSTEALVKRTSDPTGPD